MAENQDQEFDKQSFENEIETISKGILEKHLMGRKFDENKVKKWGDLIIDEIYKTLSNKYPQYGYCIFFYMSERTGLVANYDTIYYKSTDARIFINYHTDDFWSEIVMIATKTRGPMENFFNFVKNKELSSEINQKICDHLEGRKYNFGIFRKLIETICLDVNEILLAKENKPVSLHIGYIHNLPTEKIYFYYKFFNLELYPILFNYKSNSFICRVFLFLINN